MRDSSGRRSRGMAIIQDITAVEDKSAFVETDLSGLDAQENVEYVRETYVEKVR